MTVVGGNPSLCQQDILDQLHLELVGVIGWFFL